MRDSMELSSYSEIKDVSVTMLKVKIEWVLYHHYQQSRVAR